MQHTAAESAAVLARRSASVARAADVGGHHNCGVRHRAKQRHSQRGGIDMATLAVAVSGLFWIGLFAAFRGDYSLAFSCMIPALLISAFMIR